MNKDSVKALSGLRVMVKALGCRTNLYEADALSSHFERAGASVVQKAPFDVALLVSCTVTAEADKKSRQMIRRFRRLAPDSIIVATGCWAQKLDKSAMSDLPIDILAGNRHKSEIVELVSNSLQDRVPVFLQTDVLKDSSWDLLSLDHPHFHSRAFLKVQDGCDHFCSYCIIPYVRGKSVSRPMPDVKKEIHSVVASGCSEIVFTGVHLGLYGRDTGESLAELVRETSSIDGVRRIRFGSLEPFSVDEELIRVLAATEQFCPHLHLPLQSGSDRILERMRRGHTARDFLNLAESLRDRLGDNLHISTDILVGFPGEDEDDFNETLDVLKKAGIGRIHSFPYSPREGTPAASYKDQLPRKTAEERCKKVINLGKELLNSYCKRWIGQRVSVMVEEVDGDCIKGYTPHFVRAIARGKAKTGQECLCIIDEVADGELRGSVIAH